MQKIKSLKVYPIVLPNHVLIIIFYDLDVMAYKFVLWLSFSKPVSFSIQPLWLHQEVDEKKAQYKEKTHNIHKTVLSTTCSW